MKTNTKNSIRTAYEAPEATCMELLTESCMQTLSKVGNTSTEGYDDADSDDNDNWF